MFYSFLFMLWSVQLFDCPVKSHFWYTHTKWHLHPPARGEIPQIHRPTHDTKARWVTMYTPPLMPRMLETMENPRVHLPRWDLPITPYFRVPKERCLTPAQEHTLRACRHQTNILRPIQELLLSPLCSNLLPTAKWLWLRHQLPSTTCDA